MIINHYIKKTGFVVKLQPLHQSLKYFPSLIFVFNYYISFVCFYLRFVKH